MSKKILVSIFIGLVVLPGLALGLNNILEGYRTTSTVKIIEVHSDCKEAKQTGSNSYFIPTKSLSEWSAFKSNKPSDVNLPDCPPGVLTWQFGGGAAGLPSPCPAAIPSYTATCSQPMSCFWNSCDPKTSVCSPLWLQCVQTRYVWKSTTITGPDCIIANPPSANPNNPDGDLVSLGTLCLQKDRLCAIGSQNYRCDPV